MSTPEAILLLPPLARWFEAQRRVMPWRAKVLDEPHPDPYAVLVSEAMLQQTQVATVLPYFERWMQRFPTLQSLAAAEASEVANLWAGLGYYQRARNLQRAAQVLAEHGWPGDLAGLRALPGLGPYAAAAVAAIAFQWPEAALDGNALRVLARLLALEGDPKVHAPWLRDWLRPALAMLGPSRLSQGLMELGATHCGRKAQCPGCPLAMVCEARKQGRTEELPAVAIRPKAIEIRLWLVAAESDGHWFLHPPASRGLLSGMWRWPTLEVIALDGSPDSQPISLRRWAGWTQVYTHRREVIHPVALNLGEQPNWPQGEWVPASKLPALPMGRRDQRMRALLTEIAPTCSDPLPLGWILAELSKADAPHAR